MVPARDRKPLTAWKKRWENNTALSAPLLFCLQAQYTRFQEFCQSLSGSKFIHSLSEFLYLLIIGVRFSRSRFEYKRKALIPLSFFRGKQEKSFLYENQVDIFWKKSISIIQIKYQIKSYKNRCKGNFNKLFEELLNISNIYDGRLNKTSM